MSGTFYCPYVPLQMVRQLVIKLSNQIGFKTRYGMIDNPFAVDAGALVMVMMLVLQILHLPKKLTNITEELKSLT